MNMFQFLFCSILLQTTFVESTDALRLGYLRENLQLIPIKYTPNADYFLQKHIHESVPLLIKRFDKSELLKQLLSRDNLIKSLGDMKGRVYKGRMNATTWPIEVKMTFEEFISQAPELQLYWDALFPTSHPIYTEFSLPFCAICDPVLNSKMEYNMLYTFWNVSSLFHHDGSENFFYQVSGRKTWLLAEQSQSLNAYANNYTLQAGLSPIDPENVDLDNYPKAKDIQFIEVVTEPGDLLYIPEYWWHQVRSKGGENIGVNLWLEYFDFSSLKDGVDDVINVAAGADLFANNRRKASLPTCDNFRKSLADIIDSKHMDYTIFYGVDDGNYYALNSNSGQVLWKYEIESDAGSTGVLSEDGTNLYLAGENAFVYNFNQDGAVKWSTELADGVAAALRLINSKVIATSLDGHVYGLDATNGSIIWKSESFSGELWTSPAIYKNYIIVGVMATTVDSNGPTVTMIDTDDGDSVWKYTTSGDIFASPTVDITGNQVFVADHSGYLYSLHLKTGKMLWKYDIKKPINASPMVGPDGMLYLSSDGEVYSIDTSTKTTNWIKDLKVSDATISSPLLVPELNYIYVAVGKILYCLNAKTGSIAWQFIAEDSFMSSPRIDATDTIYIGNVDKFIYAINGLNGSLKWKTETGGPVVGSAVIPKQHMKHSFGALL